MDTRLVVTGHDDNGKAVFTSDEQVAPSTVSMMPGYRIQPTVGVRRAADLPG